MINKQVPKLFISHLLGCPIMTAEGKFIGHAADFQLSEGPPYKVVAIFYGRRGWLHRWHILYPFVALFGTSPQSYKVSWDAVASIEPARLILKPGWHE